MTGWFATLILLAGNGAEAPAWLIITVCNLEMVQNTVFVIVVVKVDSWTAKSAFSAASATSMVSGDAFDVDIISLDELVESVIVVVISTFPKGTVIF